MNSLSALLPLLNSAVPQEEDTSSIWMPQQASTVAADIDGLFDFITYWICLPFFVLIVAAMCYCVWKYRSKPGGKAEDSTSHNTPLELTWTIIPTILVLFIFWWGFTGYMDLMTPPDDAYEVDVTAQQWDWQFRYPSTGLISKELHVPPNTPVVLNMLSMDVLHGFFVPEFRVKYDIVPGRVTKVWFESENNTNENKTYDIFCTEYCGTGHSDMISKVIVHAPGTFGPWLEQASDFMKNLPSQEAGKMLWDINCKSCHTIDGTANGIAPTWKDIWGREEKFTDGTSQIVDDDYVIESIYEPNKKIVEGYKPQMNSYKGRISEAEIRAIIWFMKSISSSTKDEAEAQLEKEIEEKKKAEEEAEGEADDSSDGNAADSDNK